MRISVSTGLFTNEIRFLSCLGKVHTLVDMEIGMEIVKKKKNDGMSHWNLCSEHSKTKERERESETERKKNDFRSFCYLCHSRSFIGRGLFVKDFHLYHLKSKRIERNKRQKTLSARRNWFCFCICFWLWLIVICGMRNDFGCTMYTTDKQLNNSSMLAAMVLVVCSRDSTLLSLLFSHRCKQTLAWHLIQCKSEIC